MSKIFKLRVAPKSSSSLKLPTKLIAPRKQPTKLITYSPLAIGAPREVKVHNSTQYNLYAIAHSITFTMLQYYILIYNTSMLCRDNTTGSKESGAEAPVKADNQIPKHHFSIMPRQLQVHYPGHGTSERLCSIAAPLKANPGHGYQ